MRELAKKKKAYWILIRKEDGHIVCKCSECGCEQIWPVEECPQCGRKMELED